MPENTPRAHDLNTPDEWRGTRGAARPAGVCDFSFAIGPIELLDTAAHERERSASPKDTAVIVVDRPTGWSPRGLPDVPCNDWRTPRLRHARRLIEAEDTVGYVAQLPDACIAPPKRAEGWFSRYAMSLYSPGAQTVTLGVHWGPYWLNGQALEPVPDTQRGNRLNASVDLGTGWNLLCGEPEVLQPSHPVQLAWPRSAGLTVRSTPDAEDPYALRFLPARHWEPDERWAVQPPAWPDELPGHDAGWVGISAHDTASSPAFRMAWDQYASTPPDEHPPEDAAAWPLRLKPGQSHSILLDFEREYLGHFEIDIDAPAGTVLDLAYGEHLREDGALALFESNPFTHTADRYVCAGGRQVIEGFHPRGGRFAQLTIRPTSANEQAIQLHRVRLRSARAWPSADATFQCSRPSWNRAWQLAIDTLEASTEDTFCDSPWRERGTYLADSYVQSLSHLAVCRDRRIVGRTLELFAQSQRADGQIACVAAGWLNVPHADFSLIYAIWLRDVWARTGDMKPVRQNLSVIDRLFASPTWKASTHSPLWDSDPSLRVFIDWGASRDHRALDENGVLNAFRCDALAAAAQLNQAAGRPDVAKTYEEQHRAVAAAFRDRLWLPDHGRFAPGTSEGQPCEADSLHTNILALAYDLCNKEQRPGTADYVIHRLQANTAHAARGEPADDFAELYFLHYAFEALLKLDRRDMIETLIEECLELMERHGAWAYWECLHRGVNGRGSWCHAWSTAPLSYFSREVLGVREAEPGQPDRVRIDPRTQAIDHASGTVPHARGLIHIRWQRDKNGCLDLQASGPDGVTLIDADDRTPAAL